MLVNKTILADKHIAILKLNRPEKLNSITPELNEELQAALLEIDQDPEIYVVILSGEGRAFCCGADLSGRLNRPVKIVGMYGDPIFVQSRNLQRTIELMRQPVIAAMNGHAVGGGMELALSCDLRIAARDAKYGLTEVKIGAIPGAGGTQRMPRVIGVTHALELLYTGQKISGERAEQIGLVNYAVDADKVMDKAMELAETMAGNAPLALESIKQCVRKGIRMDLERGLDLENYYANRIVKTADRAEGMSAFLEKRKPNWTLK